MGLLIKLQNGDTALKSLKFGNDRLGGGSSNQPYIKNPILDDPGQLSQADNDFILRGGLKAPINAAEDVARLTKYMFDFKSPSGLLFIAKQNLLSRVSPKTQTSTGPAYAGGAINNGIYTPLSTLAQAGVGFLGIHLNKQGIDPTGLIDAISIKKYGDVVTFSQPTEDNRLVNLSLYSTTINGVGINQGQDILTYGGGPGSVLGVGKTHIRYADQRTGINNPLSDSNPKYFYNGGLVRLNSDIIIHNDKITYGLGASKEQGLDDSQIGINDTGTFTSYYNYSLPYSTLSKDSERVLKSLSGSGGYQIGLVRPKTEINYNDLLGASNAEGLYNTQNYLSEGGQFVWINGETRNFGPHLPNSTLSKDSKGLILTGSNGYQSNRSLAILSHNAEPTYISPINTILSNSGTGNTQGVSGSGRQLITNLKYDQNIGTFILQNNDGKNLGEYSSKNTLWNDNLNETYEVSPKNHKEGYLANLDKNSGYYIDKKGNYTFALAQYPRNIAPDFRKTDRTVRGFTDFSTPVRGTNLIRGSYDIITTEGSNYADTDSYSAEKTIDKIYYSSEQKRTSRKINDGYDLIKFRIGIIDPRTPSNITQLNFRAYIDDFSDSFSSDWKDQTYMGRAEKFYKYNAFNRSISLGFTIVADSKANLNIMYEQLNTLAASLAPTYTTFGYMAGNLHQLTVGDYIVNQTGAMSGLTYEIIEDSPWEIDEGSQLPLYIKVSGIKFTPIHNFRPESQFNGVHAYIKQS